MKKKTQQLQLEKIRKGQLTDLLGSKTKIQYKLFAHNIWHSFNFSNFRYGYHVPRRPQQGFYFSRPKYEIYPYSQHDIPPARYHPQWIPSQGYPSARVPQRYHHLPQAPQQQLHTSVSIEQSHGFEITPEEYNGYAVGGALQHEQQNYNYHQQQQQQHSQYAQQGHVEEEQGPVIVLRIPGPSKYAAHLQALLQKYLEVRAAQYIAELQQQEQIQYEQQLVPHHSISQEPQYIVHSTTAKSYSAPEYLPKGTQSTISNYVTPNPDHGISSPHGFTTPESIIGSSVSDASIYSSHSVYENHQVVQSHDGPHTQQQQQQQHISYRVPEQSPAPPQHVHDDASQHDYQSYTQSYSYDTAPQLPDHSDDSHDQHQQTHYVYEDPNLPISENYPSNRHTQVFFRNQHHHSTPEPEQHLSPSLFQAHVQSQSPEPVYQSPEPVYQSPEPVYQSPEPVYQSPEPVYQSPQPQYEDHSVQYQQISITPKPNRGPYNYHAHPTETPRNSKRNVHQFSSKISARLRKVPTKMRSVIRVEEESEE